MLFLFLFPLLLIGSPVQPFLEWLLALSNQTAPPLVNSVSYGDDEPSLDLKYMQQVNTQLAALGSRGISILFASGDSGVGGGAGCGPNGQFVPSFPAGSPYVTAVGGTTLQDAFERGPEVAWSGSGGGFSNVWPIPTYQSAAVATYLKNAKHLPNQNLWNRTGRAFPGKAFGYVVFEPKDGHSKRFSFILISPTDVSAFSTGFLVVTDLLTQPVDGTR